MFKVCVLGLGAMGRRMALRLLAAGHQVCVWNRSPAPVAALLEAGASAAASPREAVAGAQFVMAMLRDDEASRAVWCDPVHGALAGMAPGALAIESSTLSPAWVRTLGAQAVAVGLEFLEAPVSGSRPAADAGQLVYLAGGAPATFGRAVELLRCMGSTAHHVGPLGSGALAKLATNALLGAHVAALAEVVTLLRRQHCDLPTLLRAVATTPVWAPVDHYLAGSMLSGDFSPQFPVTLMAKDFAYALDAAGGAPHAPTLAAVRALFEQGVDLGLGEENMTGVIRALGV